jgi:zinc/manganese transport system substrate-binding protein
MRRRIFGAALAALFAAVPGAAAELSVVSTLPDLGTVAEVVGGDRVEVTVLCPGDMDPHFLPAKPSLARKLGKADALIYNGLELEVGWLPLLIGKARNPDVKPGQPGEIDCAAALTVVLDVPDGEVDRGMGDIHPQGNPHYTLDPRRMIEVADLLAERFARLDPGGAETYLAGAAEFRRRVDEKMPVWTAAAAGAASRPVILYHRSWNYLADWLDLTVIGEVENRPGIAPSPRHVKDLIYQGRHLDGVLILAAHWDHHDVGEEIAERMGATLVVLPGQTGAQDTPGDWFGLMDTITARLADATSPEVEP